MADVMMDKEMRARLMGLMPCSSNGTYEWTPDLFREKVNNEYVVPEDKWPVFDIRPLSTKEHASMRRALLSSGRASAMAPDKVADLSELMFEAVRKLVMGWHNIVDMSTNTEYAYEADAEGGPRKDRWEHIPDSIKGELFSQVCTASGLVKPNAEDRMAEVRRGL